MFDDDDSVDSDIMFDLNEKSSDYDIWDFAKYIEENVSRIKPDIDNLGLRIKSKVKYNRDFPYYETYFQIVIKRANKEEDAIKDINILLELGFGKFIDVPDGSDKITPMHTAVIKGYIDVIKLLVKSGSQTLKIQSSNRGLPIHYAVREFNIKTILALLELDQTEGKQMLHARGTFGSTVMHYAARGYVKGNSTSYNRRKTVKLLLKLGVKLDDLNKRGETPIHCALDSCPNGYEDFVIEFMQLYIQLYTRLHKLDSFHLEMKRILHTKCKWFGHTLIHQFATRRCTKLIELLIHCDTKIISMQNNSGETPMHKAALNSNEDLMGLLARYNSDAIDIKDNTGYTPCMALYRFSYKSVLYLGNDYPFCVQMCLRNKVPPVPFDEDKSADLRYKVYFNQSLVHTLLSVLFYIDFVSC